MGDLSEVRRQQLVVSKEIHTLQLELLRDVRRARGVVTEDVGGIVGRSNPVPIVRCYIVRCCIVPLTYNLCLPF